MADTNLINKSDLKKALRISGFTGDIVAGVALRLAGYDKLNEVYSKIREYQGVDFVEHLLEYLDITLDVNEDALYSVPKQGAVVFTCNHPFGGLDGMLAIKILHKVRPDLKVLTSTLIASIPNTAPLFISVNTSFGYGRYVTSSLIGTRRAEEHLSHGGALVVFPAGEISTNRERTIKDPEWKSSMIKMIIRAKAQVVPIFFEGRNSRYFHFLNKLSTKLSSLRLPAEMNRKRGREIKIRVGFPIKQPEFARFSDYKELSRYLRNRTYALEALIEAPRQEERAPLVPLEPFVDPQKIIAELNALESKKLFDVDVSSCYLLDYADAPNLMTELAIRREEAFRKVGEGTGKAADTDEYDLYYKHLILWDNKQNDLLGAYRLGLGREVLEKRGVEGFYTHTLFNYKTGIEDFLRYSVELGRSFVAADHQRDTLALMLLLKGLFYTMIKYEEYRYLFGPVSISDWYPPLYKSLIIAYLRNNYPCPELIPFVAPKKPFVADGGRSDINSLLAGGTTSLEAFDRYIYRLSNLKYKLPTLLKKYLKLNARIADFNVDPEFNYCVDGLIVLRLEDVPTDDIESLSKEFEDISAIYKRFYNW